MGKKKSFIDKKKAATFSLVFRDSSDAPAEGEEAPDRIFVRSDGRDDTAPGFEGAESRWGEGSEFTPEDGQFSEAGRPPGLEGFRHPLWAAPRKPLPEHVRKQIIEMGFPDDGYDYTQHMRELRGGGVGAIAVTPEFNLRADVRAYNARSVRVRPAEEDELLAEVEAAEGVKPIAKLGANVLDADILKLLEESGSEGGDDEDQELEDDFVIAANMGEGDEEEKAPAGREQRVGHGAVRDWLGSTKEEVGGSDPRLADFEGYEEWSEEEEEEEQEGTSVNGLRRKFTGSSIASDVKNRDRPTRLLDERFENLAVREYDSDDESEMDDSDARGQADISQFDSVLDSFLEDRDVHPDEYHTLAEEEKARAGTGTSAECPSERQVSDKQEDASTVGARVGKEAGEAQSLERASLEEPSTSGRGAAVGLDATVKSNASVDEGLEEGSDEGLDVLGELREEKEVIWVEEEDEREHWDCDTIVSTYSNLDNHPVRIGAPPNKFKNLGSERGVQRGENAPGVIRLSGKQGLPMEYLPKRAQSGGVEGLPGRAPGKENEEEEKRGPSQKVAGPRAGEGKEEKKARKTALKEQRRESRVVKRSMKALYKAEAQKAIHKAAAAAGAPQGIRLP